MWTRLFWFIVRLKVRNRRKCTIVYHSVWTTVLCWSVLLTLVLSFAGTCFAQGSAYGDATLIRMAERKNSGASPVKNIRVEAIYIDDPDNHVKLNVSWDPPTEKIWSPYDTGCNVHCNKVDHLFTEGTMPTSYGVKQIPLNATGHCDHHGGFETFGVSSDQTSELINEYVIPGCSYRIEVISQPDNDVDLPYVNFNVPDCVGRKCSCKDMSFMPALEARAKQIAENTVRVVWKIPAFANWTNLYNLTKVRIYINAHSTFMSKMVYERAVSNADANRTQIEDITIPDIIPGGFYKFEVFLENNHFCTTKGAALQLQIQFVQDQSIHMVTVMITLLFSMVLTGFIIVVMWKKRCCWSVRKCWLSQPQARRIYRPVCADGYRGRHHFTIPMEYNSLYIKDKEILEERERGKADKYEICYTRLKIGSKIGGGAFGQVFRAKATGIAGFPGVITVAVKKLKKTATPEELEEFLLEIGMLKQIGQHPNIVTMLGCCTSRQPYCMIMEYVPCGDLLHYLRALRVQYEQKGKSFLFTVNKNFDVSPDQDTQKLSDCSYITPESLPSNRLPSVTETEYTMLSSEGVPLTPITPQPDSPGVLECVLDPKELQSFSLQIAKGMKYLEKKQIVHRDLAARNVLITENKTLKISDFGLSRRGIYVNTKHKRVPLRWLSIEAIRDNLYTSKSDVWAYGIVLWEIGTLGGFPYPTVANGEILNFLLAGKRLEKPENCTDELYSLMQKCWAHSGDQRPSFTDLVKYLESISNRKRVYVDFSQLNPSYIFPPTEEQATTETTTTEDPVKTVEIVLTTPR